MSNEFKHDFSNQHTATTPSSDQPKKNSLKQAISRRLSLRWYPVLGALFGFFFILLFIGGAGQDASARISTETIEWLNPEFTPLTSNTAKIRTTQVQAGDNSTSVLQRLGFGNSSSYRIVQAANTRYKLKNIHINHTFKRIDSSIGITVKYNINAEECLHIVQANGQKTWQASVQKRQIFTRQRLTSGTIDGSLFNSAARAGIDHRTTMNLVDIFAWDIDFARDMRRGDSFRIIYEERFDDEGNVLESSIFAAEFINQGKTFQSVRYAPAHGKVDYFTPDGKGMQKTYLKAPVKFSRISSRFSTKRKHPVLGYTRAHRGVDYAARSGTPIHALGNGRIKFKGWKNGYGRFILIQHDTPQHSTAYAHMRSFARGIKRGSRVKQGQVIGYVGMSGLATGPHLHFEFRSRGRAVNPLTIKLKHPSKPIARSQMARFKQQTQPFIQQLKQPVTYLAWG